MKWYWLYNQGKMRLNFKKFIIETQDRIPKYMKHTIYKVKSQKAAWENYLLHLQYLIFI